MKTASTTDKKSLTGATDKMSSAISKDKNASKNTSGKKTSSKERRNLNVDRSRKKNKSANSFQSRWPRMPQSLQNTILTLMDESMSPFICPGSEAVGANIRNNIRTRVQRTLSKMKAPQESCTNAASLKSAQKILTAEKARLEDFEAALQGELRSR